jgi:hypothetical protein
MKVGADGFALGNYIDLPHQFVGSLVCGDDIAVVGFDNGHYSSVDLRSPNSLSVTDMIISSIYAMDGAYLPPSLFFFIQQYSNTLYSPFSGTGYPYLNMPTTFGMMQHSM